MMMHYATVYASLLGKASFLALLAFIILKRENLVVNHKRTERTYKEEGLALRRKRRGKGAAGTRVAIPLAMRHNEHRPTDVVSDSIVPNGVSLP